MDHITFLVAMVIVTALAFDMTWLLGLPSSSSHALFGALGHDAGPPVWVVLTAGLAIAMGTYIGGWRIIRTMGKGIVDIESPQGFAAESAVTAVILSSANLGFALSTTQVCSGGILAAVVVAGVIVVLSRHNPVHADNVNNARTTSVRPVTAGAGA